MNINTPLTDAVLNTFNGVAAKLAADLATHAEKSEREIAAVTKERDQAREYADKLAESLPDGMLPKDVEVLRQANLGLALELHEVREQRDRLAGALHLIANGSSCRECGGEDQARLAREAIQSIICDALRTLTPNA